MSQISVLIEDHLSSRAQSRMLAKMAKVEIDRVKAANDAASGSRSPAPRIEVDGVKGAPLSAVKPDGLIVASFNPGTRVVDWIIFELEKISPRKSGDYERSHAVFVNGQEHVPGDPLPADAEIVILNKQPYARKIEGGSSKQAPKGVYQAIATVAASRFKDLAWVKFTYRSALLSYQEGGKGRAGRRALRSQPARQSAIRMEKESRVPAIRITMK